MTEQISTIAFIGAGNMASAIIGGLIENGYPKKHILAADPYQPSLDKLEESYGVSVSTDNQSAIKNADVVVLAVKPQQMKIVCQNLGEHLPSGVLCLSIAAGITCEMLSNWLGNNPAIVRCMPNTPALVQTGATGMFPNKQVTEEHKALSETLLQAIGIAVWVEEEALLDAVTALSGSGPAYFFLMIESMISAAVDLGLSRDAAQKLAMQTALGAAKMAISSDVDVVELRRRVTSPAGTTEAAIKSFEADDFRGMVNKALKAADDRSKSLAREME